jgi:hypothetical protein
MLSGIGLLVIGVIVVGIVLAARRRGGSSIDAPDGVSIRHLFVHLMLFASAIVGAIGLMGLGTTIDPGAAGNAEDLAGPLAMALVGGAVFGGLTRSTIRAHVRDPDERRSLAWALYLNAMLVVSMVVAVVCAVATADGFLDGNWHGVTVAGAVVWGGLWAGHWWAWRRATPTMLPMAHIWILSVMGLWMAATATWISVGSAVEAFLANALSLPSAITADQVWLGLIAAAFGAAAWVWHWLLHGVHAARHEGWLITVLLFGTLAGLALAVASAGVALYFALLAGFGETGALTTSEQLLRIAMPAIGAVVGWVVWHYHHRLVIGTGERTEVHRVHDYLETAVGVVTVAVAVAMLVLAGFAAIADLPGGADGARRLLAAATLLVVGLPVWTVGWRRVQRLAAADGTERESPARRTYLLSLFGVGGMVAFGALIGLLIGVFEWLLGDSTAGELAASIDLPAALLVATAAIAAYHWRVYRSERETHARPTARDVLLVDGFDVDVKALEDRIHAKVRLLHRLDMPEGSEIGVDAVANAIERSEGRHLLVLTGADRVDVVPYE